MNIGKHIEKPLSMKQLWTTLADRRRAGPPAFRRKYRKLPYATLSFPRWPSLFERILAVEEGVGAHSEPLAVTWVYITEIFKNFQDLKNWPYDFPETLHASPHWLVMKKCRRRFFRNWTGCGDRGKKRLFLSPKKRQI